MVGGVCTMRVDVKIERMERKMARHASLGGALPQPDAAARLSHALIRRSGTFLSSLFFLETHSTCSSRTMRHQTWQFSAASATKQTQNTNAQPAS